MNNFAKDWKIDIMQSGHMSVRARETRLDPGALPLFSTDTEEEARDLIVHFGRLQYDGSYVATDFGGGVEDIEALTDKMDSIGARE